MKTADTYGTETFIPAEKRSRARKLSKKPGSRQVLGTAIFLIVLAGGWVYPVLGYFIPLCMLLGLGIAFKNGRKWCGTLCPRGIFYDSLIKPVSAGKKIPLLFKRLPLRIGVLSFLFAMLTVQIILRWPDFLSIGRFFVTLITITTGVGLVLAFSFHERTWCYICPIGTLSKWAGREKNPVQIEASACVSCKLCSKTCPMQIKPFSYKEESRVLDPDCIKCGTCVASCPKKALTL